MKLLCNNTLGKCLIVFIRDAVEKVNSMVLVQLTWKNIRKLRKNFDEILILFFDQFEVNALLIKRPVFYYLDFNGLHVLNEKQEKPLASRLNE